LTDNWDNELKKRAKERTHKSCLPKIRGLGVAYGKQDFSHALKGAPRNSLSQNGEVQR
jgi:hypothetical protein